MRKRYLIIIVILVLVVSTFSIMFYLSLPTTFPNVFNEPLDQGNGTEEKGFLGLPFKLPWQTTTQTASNKSSGGGGGGQQGGGGGGTGGSTGSNITNPTLPATEVYTLSVNSIPSSLRIYTGYYINNVISSSASDTPYNLGVDADSRACVIPAFVIGDESLRWEVDGQICQFSLCEEFYLSETEILYTDYGCLINMNDDHSIILYYNQV